MTPMPGFSRTALARGAFGVLAIWAWAAMAGTSMAQPPVKLAPHRAVYELSLERSAAGSGVTELSGRMVYELKGNDCKGYEQRTRFVTRTQNQKGDETLTDLRSLYVESGDATRFRFDTTQYQNDRLTEQTTGEARRKEDGAPELRVNIKKPIRKRTSLKGADILFPIEHTKALLAAALAGKRIFVADLYDGSEKGLKVFETTAVVGDRKAAGAKSDLPALKNGAVLDRQPSWPVSLSYYAKDGVKGDAVPEYEIAFQLYENGVSRKLFIDYGNFAIRGVLSHLEMLEPGKCVPK